MEGEAEGEVVLVRLSLARLEPVRACAKAETYLGFVFLRVCELVMLIRVRKISVLPWGMLG